MNIEQSSVYSASDFENNLFFSNGDSIILNLGQGWADTTIYPKFLRTADFDSYSFGSNNIIENPQFADTSTGNLRLLSSSAAIDSGRAITKAINSFYSLYGIDIEVDKDGVSRPYNSVLDIGAYEYTGASTTTTTTTTTTSGTTTTTTTSTTTSTTTTGGGTTTSTTTTTTIDGSRTQLTYDDFESGWGNYLDGGAYCEFYTSGDRAHQGNNAAAVKNSGGLASSFYYTNGVDVATPGYTQLKVKFWYYPFEVDDSGDQFSVMYWDGTDWNTIQSFAYTNDVYSIIFSSIII